MPCLDTTLLIDVLGRGGRRLQDRAQRKVSELYGRDHTVATTRFNIAELWVGVERSPNPEQDAKKVARLLRPLVILEFDEAAARVFGRITALLQTLGQPAGDMDVLIASVALVHGHTLITRNPKHFDNVPGLVVETY